MPGVSRHAGDQGADLQTRRPRSQGLGRTVPRLPGAVVPAGSGVRLTGGLQRPAGRLVGAGQSLASTGCWGVARRIGSRPTGRDAGAATGGAQRRVAALDPVAARSLRAAATATTTRCTRSRSGGASRSPRTWGGSGSSVAAPWSPTTSGSGPNTRRSPIPSMSRRPSSCAASASTSSARRAHVEVEQRRLDRLRHRCWASMGRWRDGRQDHHQQPRRDRRAGVSDPGLEGADAARGGRRGSPNGPAPSPGPTRSSWRRVCNVKSPPANPTAVKAASGLPASRHGSRWRSSTSTTPAASNATSSPTSGPWTSSPPKTTWCSSGPPEAG